MASVVGITFVDESQNFDFEKSGKSSRPCREKWSMLLSVPFLFRKWNNFSRALIALWIAKHTEKLNSNKTLNFHLRFRSIMRRREKSSQCLRFPLILNLVPRAFPLKVGGAGKDPGIGWSRVHLTPGNPGCNKLARFAYSKVAKSRWRRNCLC